MRRLDPPTETEPFDSEELRCFPPGRNEPAGPAMIEMVRHVARDLPPSPYMSTIPPRFSTVCAVSKASSSRFPRSTGNTPPCL